MFFAVAKIPYLTDENRDSTKNVSNKILHKLAVYLGGLPNHRFNINSQSIKNGIDSNNIKKKENLEESIIKSCMRPYSFKEYAFVIDGLTDNIKLFAKPITAA